MSVRRPFAVLIAAVVCLAGVVPARAMGQSLADAARAEEARRQKNHEKGVKAEVVDDKALAAASGKAGTLNVVGTPGKTPATVESSGTGSGTEPAGSAAATPPAGAATRDGRGESYWRARVREAEAELAEAQAAYDELASMSLVSGEVYQDANGKTVIHSLGELRAMTARAKAERDAAKKALEDVHEDARRSGALPGWLR